MDGLDQLLALGPGLGPGSRVFVIQLLLVLGIVVIVAWLFIKRGAKQLAVRRLLIIAFAVFAVLTVLFPGVLSRVANLVGVGRGADLLLYATVLVLLGFLALQEARTKAAEKRTTYLARRLALDEAESPAQFRERSLRHPED
jgi:small membrane protein